MPDAMHMYFRYIGASMRSQMQYRASFLMFMLGGVLITGTEFLALWAMFDRFTGLGKWTLPQVSICYGMVLVAFAIGQAVARGFDTFGIMVKSGQFDRLLLRPRTTAGQLFGQELLLMRLGRLVQGAILLLWGAAAAGVDWTPATALLVTSSILAGASVFVGLYILQATMCFWTIDALEVMNCLTDGGSFAARVPLTVYRTWFRRFFTYVVPLACVNYFPLTAIVPGSVDNATTSWAPWASPLLGLAFVAVSLQVWRFGVRHYRSTGS